MQHFTEERQKSFRKCFLIFILKKVSLLRFKSALFVNNQRKLHISTRIPTHTYIYITTHSTNIYINTRIYIYICVYIYIYIYSVFHNLSTVDFII